MATTEIVESRIAASLLVKGTVMKTDYSGWRMVRQTEVRTHANSGKNVVVVYFMGTMFQFYSQNETIEVRLESHDVMREFRKNDLELHYEDFHVDVDSGDIFLDDMDPMEMLEALIMD